MRAERARFRNQGVLHQSCRAENGKSKKKKKKKKKKGHDTLTLEFSVYSSLVYHSSTHCWGQSTSFLTFYLIHQQANNPVVAGLLWVPYLRSFPCVLVITTLLSLGIAYLITKSGWLRYFYGLPPPKGSCLPGERVSGFLPVIILAVVEVLVLIIANTV